MLQCGLPKGEPPMRLMRDPSAAVLLLIGASPITTSVAVLPILPNTVVWFSDWPGPELIAQIYFVIPTLMTALMALMLRGRLAQIDQRRLLAVGIAGFAAFGVGSGFVSSGEGAMLTRAGVGASAALIIMPFNVLASRGFDGPTSTWLLTYQSPATSCYGLLVTAATTWLAAINWRYVHFSFSLPLLLLGMFVLTRFLTSAHRLQRPIAPYYEGASTLDRPRLIWLVAVHMLAQILVFLQIGEIALTVGLIEIRSAAAMTFYLGGQLFGAVIYRVFASWIGSVSSHIRVALIASFVSTVGLSESEGTASVLPCLVLAGLSFSHIMPAVFEMMRESFHGCIQERMIGSVIAASFFGQFAAPFVPYCASLLLGFSVSPATAAAAASTLLLPTGCRVSHCRDRTIVAPRNACVP